MRILLALTLALTLLTLSGCITASKLLDLDEMGQWQAMMETINPQICLDVDQSLSYGPYSRRAKGYISLGKGQTLDNCIKQLEGRN